MSSPTNLQAPARPEGELGSGVQRVRDITFTRGEGATLWDADGRSYIDCSAAYGVASLGHAHPTIASVISAQARQLIATGRKNIVQLAPPHLRGNKSGAPHLQPSDQFRGQSANGLWEAGHIP